MLRKLVKVKVNTIIAIYVQKIMQLFSYFYVFGGSARLFHQKQETSDDHNNARNTKRSLLIVFLFFRLIFYR